MTGPSAEYHNLAVNIFYMKSLSGCCQVSGLQVLLWLISTPWLETIQMAVFILPWNFRPILKAEGSRISPNLPETWAVRQEVISWILLETICLKQMWNLSASHTSTLPVPAFHEAKGGFSAYICGIFLNVSMMTPLKTLSLFWVCKLSSYDSASVSFISCEQQMRNVASFDRISCLWDHRYKQHPI